MCPARRPRSARRMALMVVLACLPGCVIKVPYDPRPRDVRPVYAAHEQAPPGEHRELETGLFVLGGQVVPHAPPTGVEPKRR